MAFSQHALDILEKNYFARDKKGNLIEKTPEEMMTRISRAIFHDSPELALDLYDALMAQEVIFNSPVMFNIGLPTKQILAACWVGDLQDDMDSIMRAAHITGIVFKYGSGMGLPITNLRPKNDIVSNSGYASGPLSFLEVFNKIADVVKSGGKRRAAFMSMARCDHPDIQDIIAAKDSAVGSLGGQPLENMNISVAATDEFMRAARNNEPFKLRFEKHTVKTINASDLFNQICESAWKSADPGLFFIDTVNRVNPLPKYAMIQTTNPCGEQPLHPWTCCNLGHINLNALTRHDGIRWEFDYERLQQLTVLMTKALDRIIDIMDYPSKEFEKNTLQTRPIGLGHMGFAEVCYKLRVPYSNSQKLLEEVSHLIISTSIETSIDLAGEFGTTEVISDNLDTVAELVLDYTGDHDLYQQVLEYGIRNSSWTTLAPTGTTSLAVDAKSYGIEPHFGLAYRKNFVDTREDVVASKKYYINETFLEAVKPYITDTDRLVQDIMANNGSCQGLKYLPDEITRVFEVAHDLTPVDHLRIMAAAQPYISSAISKTINLPNTATVDDIKEIYFSAWELDLKGVTIYRDGCKEFQPIDFGTDRPKTIEDFKKLGRGVSIPRGDTTEGGEIDAWRTACTKMYVIPGFAKNYENILIETFLAKKSGGGCDANLNAIALLISLALRKGVQVQDIVDELYAIICPNCKSALNNGKDINALSCPRAIAQTLMKQKDKALNYQYIQNAEKKLVSPKKGVKVKISPKENTCKSCGAQMIMAAGCITCPECGDGGCDHGRD